MGYKFESIQQKTSIPNGNKLLSINLKKLLEECVDSEVEKPRNQGYKTA